MALPPPPPPPKVSKATKPPKPGQSAVLNLTKTLKKTEGPKDRKKEFEDEARKMKLNDQQLEEFLEQYKGVKSQGALLSHDKNLSVLRQLVLDTLDEKGEESSSSSSSTVLLAFDFDYTLKVHHGGELQVRGKKDSIEFLKWARKNGCEVVVITAQEPTKLVVKNLLDEVRGLQLDEVFECVKWDWENVNELFRSWGPNSQLNDHQLTAKLATLLTLRTERFPADLARLMSGPTIFGPTCTFPPDCFTQPLTWVQYRTWQERDYDTFIGEDVDELSGALYLHMDPKDDEFTCPVRCWIEFDQRNLSRHYAADTPDRTFVHEQPDGYQENARPNPSGSWWDGNWSGRWWSEGSWQSNGVPKPRVHKVKRNFFEHDSYQERVPIHKALTPEELTDLVRETLTLAKTPEHHVNDVLYDTILEHDVPVFRDDKEDIVKVCQKGRLMASRYNKPEAIALFRRQLKKDVRSVIFIDDSAANAFNVYGSFCKHELDPSILQKGQKAVPVLSIWWPPPPNITKDMSLPLHSQCMEYLHRSYIAARPGDAEGFGNLGSASGVAQIALIGCGWWAQGWHLPHLHRNPKSVIVAIVDTSPDTKNPLNPKMESLEQLGSRYNTPTFGSVDELLQSEINFDGVIISTPHTTHKEISLKLLKSERSPHIFCEKPMATDPNEARELHEAAASRKKDRLFMVNHTANWRPQTKIAADLISRGDLGSIKHVTCSMASSLAILFENPGFKNWNEPSGTMLGNGFAWGQGSHILAWIFYVSGLIPKSVYCQMHHSSTTGADIYDTAVITCENGATISYNGNGVLPGSNHSEKKDTDKPLGKLVEMKIFGENGALLYGGDDARPDSGSLEFRKKDGSQQVFPGGFLFENYEEDGYGPESLRAFVDGCLGDQIFIGATSEIGCRTVLAIEAMYRSAKEGKSVDIL